MGKWFVAIGFLWLALVPANAQQWKLKRIEAIMGVGTASVFGDLGGKQNATSVLFIKDFTFRSTRPSVTLGLRYRIDPRSTVKTSFIYGYSKTEDFTGSRNELRGFSSVTQLFEFSGHYEYYFLSENRQLKSAAMFNRRGMVNNYSSFGAYGFAGLGATLFWPNLTYSEPREGDEYKNNMGVTIAIPIGIGLKYIISDKWIVGYEIGYRQTVSDLLDGFISPFSKTFDVYWFSSLNLSFRIPTSRRGLPLFLDPRFRGPRL